MPGTASSTRIAHVWIDYEDGSWVALGHAPDGTSYTAVADSLQQLKRQIHESAEVEGWPGLVIYR